MPAYTVHVVMMMAKLPSCRIIRTKAIQHNARSLSTFFFSLTLYVK